MLETILKSKANKTNQLFLYLRAAAIVLFLFIFLTAIQTPAATVTKTADTNDGVCDADCSLREAINTAPNSDTIVFSSLFNSSQTITLTLGELLINKDLTITGKGARLLTVSGNNASRVFKVTGTQVNISGLTIANGNVPTVVGVGGGIWVEFGGTTLNLSSVTIRNNNAGFVGGGVLARGRVNITNSTISNNTSVSDGAGVNIQSNGIVNISNTTVTNNTATNAVSSSGGGITNFNGSLTLNNVTVSHNRSAEGGGLFHYGGTMSLRNTIVAANTAALGSPDIAGDLTTHGNNLIGNNEGSATSFPAGNPNANGDRVGSAAAPLDPLLGNLQNNGGQTDTRAPLAGYGSNSSLAIQTGNNCVTNLSCPTANPPAALTTDQRGTGFLRHRGSAVDIGAFELEVAVVLNTNDDGANSLRGLITAAQPGAVILFQILGNDPGCVASVCTINLTSGELSINKTVTILGLGARNTIIRRSAAAGTPFFRVLNIPDGSNTVNISGLSLTNGSNASGAGINNRPGNTLNLKEVAIRNNNGTAGGGILNYGILTVVNSTISSNTASGEGGGININSGGRATIINSTISDNASNSDEAGGIVNGGQQLDLINATITNNRAAMGTGGVLNYISAVINVRNTIIAGNRVSSSNEDVLGTFISQGNNLIGSNQDATVSFPVGNPNANGDIVGTNAAPINPQLGALANNGGNTDTHALLANSTAINRGNNCVVNLSCASNNPPAALTSDQRAIFPRRVGSFVDIGAFEAQFVRQRAPFDFDGDDKTDISIFRPSQGEWWYLRSSDGQNRAFQFGSSSDRLVPADFTGDGKTDIAFWRPASGEWFILRSENASFYSFPFGTTGDIPVVGDFDGDGRADPTVFRPSNATWYVFLSSGGTRIEPFGASGDVPVAGDYDGDSKTDLAIFRPSNGQWWLLRSTAGIIATTFGNASDKPVPADYTGDGKTDVAFWRPSTGEWFVLRSENFSYYSFPFGINSDLPTLGDYDGDGKADAAVFRPSNSTWYLNRSTAGNIAQTFGQAGDKPVPNAFVP